MSRDHHWANYSTSTVITFTSWSWLQCNLCGGSFPHNTFLLYAIHVGHVHWQGANHMLPWQRRLAQSQQPHGMYPRCVRACVMCVYIWTLVLKDERHRDFMPVTVLSELIGQDNNMQYYIYAHYYEYNMTLRGFTHFLSPLVVWFIKTRQ